MCVALLKELKGVLLCFAFLSLFANGTNTVTLTTAVVPEAANLIGMAQKKMVENGQKVLSIHDFIAVTSREDLEEAEGLVRSILKDLGSFSPDRAKEHTIYRRLLTISGVKRINMILLRHQDGSGL